MTPRFIICHLRATNDRNGNPRRAYRVLDQQTITDGNHPFIQSDYYDEGYDGENAVPEWIRKDAAWSGSIEITVGEYRTIRRWISQRHRGAA